MFTNTETNEKNYPQTYTCNLIAYGYIAFSVCCLNKSKRTNTEWFFLYNFFTLTNLRSLQQNTCILGVFLYKQNQSICFLFQTRFRISFWQPLFSIFTLLLYLRLYPMYTGLTLSYQSPKPIHIFIYSTYSHTQPQ